MPVVTYEDLKPDIDLLIAKGNSISSTLCKSPISQFFRSTGTSSGMSKLIPSTEEQAEKSRQFCSLLIPVLNQHIPGLNKGKAMQFIFVSLCTETPGGIISSLVSTSVAKTSRNLSSNINYTSPIETILCEDTHQSLYSQLLCGLYQNKQVLRLGFAFASGFMVDAKCLHQHWTLLCDDIRHGTIAEDHPKITDPSVRKAVMKILVKTNPKLADFIENECKRDSSWEGINLDPLTKPPEVSYTLIPTLAYFEFLTILGEDDNQNDNFNQEKKQHHPELVDLVKVELGREYELVVTNYAGIYRYRVGDVLRVAGFKNNAPQFNFMRRRNVVLSIDMDKTNETEFQNAVDHLMIMSNVSLVEYTSFPDTSTFPGHYVLYWELQGNNNNAVIPQKVLEECCLVMEEFLGYEYRYMRTNKKLIGP
ncbi:indole-3-acetic acid-amido synthetase GH3.6-like [Papaver somniferum]|uniref:indole-3-acetic acid-amido synthetase GH3.6-like n=1 Tax=Papaver somniferum TaxID=3469 RepID=UPI000E700C4D|nr:indole-3-acetic acid-amido synthetase GH3.6-like [Papaver somniferum]